MQRTNIDSGSKWEPTMGYSRAVRVGPFVHVSGTTATSPGGLVGIGDAYLQTVQILANLRSALERVGATFEHVVRTRVYLTRIADFPAVARAHGAVFGTIRPACTLVQVSALVDPDMLVEIEVDAIAPEAGVNA